MPRATGERGRGFTTAEVRAAAARAKVNLAQVTPTGPGGMVTLADVQAARPATDPYEAVYGRPSGTATAASATPDGAAGRAVAAAAGGRAREVRSFWNDTTVVRDEYARNPLVDDLRQANPTVYAAAMKDGPAPTMFEAGDLPVMTASGIDPQMLLQLPWQARHLAAATPDRQVLAGLFEDAAAGGADLMSLFGRHEGTVAYEARVRRWASGGGPTPQETVQRVMDEL